MTARLFGSVAHFVFSKLPQQYFVILFSPLFVLNAPVFKKHQSEATRQISKRYESELFKESMQKLMKKTNKMPTIGRQTNYQTDYFDLN